MTDEQFHDVVIAMVEAGCQQQGGELKSRQVKAVIAVVTGLIYGLAEQLNDAQKRLAYLEKKEAEANAS